MVAFKLEGFSGIKPRTSRRLLPPSNATIARNTKLLEGELRGFHKPVLIKDLSSLGFPVGRAYRIPASVTGGSDAWLAFQTQNVDIIRSPVLNDAYNRYYWASDTAAPQYNTLARIVAGNTGGNAPWLLGVPQPASALTVTPPAGSDETRSYVYTFVTAYGEEGPPTNPTTTTGTNGTWALSGFSTTWSGGSSRNITNINIYRTIPNSSNPAFFFVAQIAVGTTSYNDTASDTTVALNNTLDFTANFPPDSGMQGFALMPQGYLVGFKGRNLYFSEQYLPHAWNPSYQLATEFEIVGLVVWGQTLIICTTSNPYMGSGVTPNSFTMQKLDGVTPCLSRRGIVSTVVGAMFPTIDGLAMLNSGGLNVITQDLVTKEEWSAYSPTAFFSAQLGLQYMAFNSSNFAILINPTEPSARMVEVDAFQNVTGIETDRYTGNINLIQNNQVFDWDPNGAERLYWHWQSKEVQFPKFVNFGAFKIKFDEAAVDVSSNVQAVYGPYNTARFNAGILAPLGSTAYGSSGCAYRKGLVSGWTQPENMLPLGGGPLYPLIYMESQQVAVRFIAYCNGIKVSDQIVTDDRIRRLPAGFKHDIWQFELFGNTNVYSVQIAETGKELAKV
jgi:hypothetical protein